MGNIDTVEGRPSFRHTDLYLVKSGVRATIGEYQLFRNLVTNQMYMSIPKTDSNADYSLRCLFTHPNLLQTVGYGFGWKELMGVENPKQQLFFEYCEHTLYDIIQRKIQDQVYFNEEELLTIARDICSVLIFLRDHGINHGHLNTHSVFYDYRDNKYKVYDHALILGAKNALSIKSDNMLTYYCSPELLSEAKFPNTTSTNQLQKGVKNDLYSLGMILLEATTLYSSKDCYDIDNFTVLLNTIEDRFQSLKVRYNQRFIEVIRCLLQYDPSRRIELMALSNSLQNFDSSGTVNLGSSSKKELISWLTDEESNIRGGSPYKHEKSTENKSPLSRTKQNWSSAYYSNGNKIEILVPDDKYKSLNIYHRENRYFSVSPSREHNQTVKDSLIGYSPKTRGPNIGANGLSSLDFFQNNSKLVSSNAFGYQNDTQPYKHNNQVYIDKFSNDGIFEEMSRKYQQGNTSQSWISESPSISLYNPSQSIYKTPQPYRIHNQTIDLDYSSIKRLNRFVERGPPPNVFSIGKTSPRSLAELQRTMFSVPMNFTADGATVGYRLC